MNTRWAPLGVAVAVVAVVAGAALLGKSGSGEPPLLRLAGGSADTASGAGWAAAPQADSSRSSKIGAPGVGFRLVGALPDGPDEARARTLDRGAASEDDVRALAKALGVKGEPVRDGRTWRVAGLSVSGDAGQAWSMSRCGPDTAVASDSPLGCPGTTSASSGSGSAGSGGSDGSAGSVGSVGTDSTDPATVDPAPDAPPPAPDKPTTVEPALPVVSPCPDNARCVNPDIAVAPPPLPPQPEPTLDPEVLRTAARPILAALGLAKAAIGVESYGSQGSVTADPVVDGLPTWGYQTRIEITADGSVLSASGYLGVPAAGASYPLISAKAAFEALSTLAQQQCDGCPESVPAKVTGARLGLQLTALQGGDAILLPAWLFAVEDWPMPLPQNAVVERYVERPGEPSPPPTGERQSFGFDAAYPTDDTTTIIVQYGDSGSCPREQVTHVAKESAESVVVLLEAATQPAEQACTSDYRQVLVPVELQAPLGTRTLLDASRGEAVNVDRSCARPMGNPPPPKDCVG